MEPVRKGAFLRVFALVAVAGAVLLAAFMALVRREMHVAAGGEILHDDFGFRVVDVRSEELANAPERRVVVAFEVNNHAKRVPFALSGWTPVLVDARDRVYEPDAAAQAELVARDGDAATFAGTIDAGTSTVRRVAYAVPAEAGELKFEIQWGGSVVNVLEPLLFGAKDIALGAVPAATGR